MVEITTMAARAARRSVMSGTADQKVESRHQASIASSAGGTMRSASQPALQGGGEDRIGKEDGQEQDLPERVAWRWRRRGNDGGLNGRRERRQPHEHHQQQGDENNLGDHARDTSRGGA